MQIEIITTPNESLKESGFGSLKACNSVLHTIQRLGHKVKLNVCESKACLDDVIKRKPELVILAVKYVALKNEDDIWLSEYLSKHNVNFTGSSREVLKFDSNKVKAKMHLTNKGIQTARYFIATPGQYKSERELPFTFPLFLKPLDAANGNGIDDLSYVTSFDNCDALQKSLADRNFLQMYQAVPLYKTVLRHESQRCQDPDLDRDLHVFNGGDSQKRTENRAKSVRNSTDFISFSF